MQDSMRDGGYHSGVDEGMSPKMYAVLIDLRVSDVSKDHGAYFLSVDQSLQEDISRTSCPLGIRSFTLHGTVLVTWSTGLRKGFLDSHNTQNCDITVLVTVTTAFQHCLTHRVQQQGQIHTNVSCGAFMKPLLSWKSNKYYIFLCVCVCVCMCGGGCRARAYACAPVALLVWHVTRMRHYVCGLFGSIIFFVIIS